MDSPHKRQGPRYSPQAPKAHKENQHTNITANTVQIAINVLHGAILGLGLAWLIVGWLDWSLATDPGVVVAEVGHGR